MKLSRHHFVIVTAWLLASLALYLHNILMLTVVVLVFMLVIGLGVALPRMRLFGPYVWRGGGGRRCVALTFDDGPDARSTPALLELLRENGVPAVFFGVGRRVDEQPELAARIVREGHLLENHSFHHSNATNFFTVARLKTELAQAQAAIQKATGIAPCCFRPPMGLSNPRIFRAADALGLAVIGWTARGLDTRLTDPERIVARIVLRLRPGAIILLHDGNIPADRLVATVKRLLDTLRSLGYEVERLDRMLT